MESYLAALPELEDPEVDWLFGQSVADAVSPDVVVVGQSAAVDAPPAVVVAVAAPPPAADVVPPPIAVPEVAADVAPPADVPEVVPAAELVGCEAALFP